MNVKVYVLQQADHSPEDKEQYYTIIGEQKKKRWKKMWLWEKKDSVNPENARVSPLQHLLLVTL